MALDNTKVWLNMSGEYLLAGIPFVTGSTLAVGSTIAVNFPKVTRTVTVRNTISGSALAVAFTENGLKSANRNYFVLSGSESFTGELRVRKIFLSGAVGTSEYEVIAGLTRIDDSALMAHNEITGSNNFEGVG